MTTKQKKDACKRCATCCSYFTIATDPPVTEEDYDDLAWMLVHQDVALHVEKELWQVVINNKCRHLDYAKGCLIYEKRPQICRDHVPGECDFNAESPADYDDVELVIESLDELLKYKKKHLKM